MAIASLFERGNAGVTDRGAQRPADEGRTASTGDRVDSCVAIVGGGTAGVAAAAALRRSLPASDRIVLVEPNTRHYYQPGFTLVGGGVWRAGRASRPQSGVIPPGVTWLQTRVSAYEPEADRLQLADGRSVTYRFLVASPGLELEWDRIPGLADALGDGRVGSIYSLSTAAETWSRIRAFRGGRALFTQPPMPIKCPGAPQKIVYMAADYWRRQGVLGDTTLRFRTATPSLFSVTEYVPTLEAVCRRYGIDVGYGTRLVAVDGPRASATFERQSTDGVVARWDEPYDLLHAVPPQGPTAAARISTLADADGWLDVDPETLQHRRYPNVFGMGDATSVPTSKTAAAVRAQLPVVVANLLDVMADRTPAMGYSGYASCPLITGYGRVVLAEFVYGRKVAPSLPWDSTRERRSAWWLKTRLLPWMYWQRLLKGRDLPVVARH